MSEFIEDKYEMISIRDIAWDIYFTGNYAFINEELSSYNSLNLNDKVIFMNLKLQVYLKKMKILSEMSFFSNSANTLITNADSLANITNSNDSVKGRVEATFIIDD